MPNPWKEKIFAFNRKRAESDERSSDLMKLLSALPPGQVKQLLKDEVCASILQKYGFTGE